MRLPLHYVLLGALVTALGIYFYGHHKGWTKRDAEMQVEIARMNNEARELERTMNSKIIANANQLQEANNALTEKSSALDRAIRAGRVRLPAARCVQASPDPVAAVGNRDEARGQPDRPADPSADADDAERRTLAAIAEIVAQGDRNTAQLNACIDAYNHMKETVNGQR